MNMKAECNDFRAAPAKLPVNCPAMSSQNSLYPAFLLTLAIALPALARTETGFLDRSTTVAVLATITGICSETFQSRSWPVILFLHGARAGLGRIAADRCRHRCEIQVHSSNFPLSW